MKRTLLPLLLALAALPACKDGMGSSGTIVRLDVNPATLFLGVGDTMHVAAIGVTDDADDPYVSVSATYKSANPSVATVGSDGNVRGVAAGTTTVTVKGEGKTATVNVTIRSDGSFHTFNVTSQSNCESPVYHGARLVASSANARIYEDLENPTGGFTAAEYQSIIAELENVVYPTNTQYFGVPTDIDGNGKFTVLYTRAVNDLTPVGANFLYGGFFHPRDLFPHTPKPGFDACPSSNTGEMFYMLVPDPNGVSNGHVRPKSYVRQTTVGTIAHEFQHLINSSRRLYVNNADSTSETVWLDEALSHIAEELSFYTASGLGPRQNLGQAQVLATQQRTDAFNEFSLDNFARFDEYLRAPAVNAPYSDDDDLATRGAAWALLRYIADRRGGNEQTLWFNLVNSKINGLENLQAVLGTDPVLWARDWAVANYTDDAVPVSAVFTHPSWNFRNLYQNPSLGGFHLQVTTLGNGTTSSSIHSGSAAYYKFGVLAGQTADVRVAPASPGTVAGACTPVSLTVGQVQQLTLNNGLALCFPGGALGQDYALIPFHASNTLGAFFGITLTAAGVTAPVPPPNPVRAEGPPLFPLDGYSLRRPWDGGLEVQMRTRAWAELRHKVHRGGGGLPRFETSNVVGNILYLNVVRIR
ncbi:MAG: Ig-like domain-containing protein [Longimicrobiaceae bacterium]